MTQIASVRLGRPPAASRQEVLGLAAAHYREGRRVDVQGIARELGLARATVHRWFGTRELLIGEVLASAAEAGLLAQRRATAGGGACVLIDSFYNYNRQLIASAAFRALLANEQDRALRILTSSDGVVQPRMVATVQRLIDAEVGAGRFIAPRGSAALAYAIVRLAEAFIYNDVAIGIRGEIERLREVQASLMGVGARAG